MGMGLGRVSLLLVESGEEYRWMSIFVWTGGGWTRGGWGWCCVLSGWLVTWVGGNASGLEKGRRKGKVGNREIVERIGTPRMRRHDVLLTPDWIALWII